MSASVHNVASSRDGRYFTASCDDGTLTIWKATQREQLWTNKVLECPVECPEFNPDGTRLLSGDRQGLIQVWDVASGQEVSRRKSHGSSVAAGAFTPDGRTIATTGNDGKLVLWDGAWAGPAREILLAPYLHCIHGVAFTPEGRHVVTGNSNGTVYVLRLDSRAEAPLQSVRDD